MTLTEFLLARIAEDEAEARDGGADAMTGRFWKQFDPDAYEEIQALALKYSRRLLAECEAKRRLIKEVGPRENMGHPADVTTDYYRRGLVSMRDSNLRTLGVIYSDHPDYDADWRP